MAWQQILLQLGLESANTMLDSYLTGRNNKRTSKEAREANAYESLVNTLDPNKGGNFIQPQNANQNEWSPLLRSDATQKAISDIVDAIVNRNKTQKYDKNPYGIDPYGPNR